MDHKSKEKVKRNQLLVFNENERKKAVIMDFQGGSLPPCTPLTIKVRQHFVADLKSATFI